jgi:predicted SnoaL-like aldol condensation-catalyzing enzyme
MRLVQFAEAITTQFPQLSVEFYRTAAEGDLVVTHSLLTHFSVKI